jgi:hypothetical protein
MSKEFKENRSLSASSQTTSRFENRAFESLFILQEASTKSTATTDDAFSAKDELKRPIPEPSSSTDFPFKLGSSARISGRSNTSIAAAFVSSIMFSKVGAPCSSTQYERKSSRVASFALMLDIELVQDLFLFGLRNFMSPNVEMVTEALI